MPSFVPNELTVRERAMEAMVSLFETQAADLPAGDPYGFAWGLVARAPRQGWAFKKTYSIAVFDMHESKVDKLMVKHCSLRVGLEIGVVAQANEEPSKLMNAVFGAIQRRVQEDPTLGGLIIDVQEVTNDLQISDENQKHVMGVMYLDMKYRHSVKDPRRIV